MPRSQNTSRQNPVIGRVTDSGALGWGRRSYEGGKMRLRQISVISLCFLATGPVLAAERVVPPPRPTEQKVSPPPTGTPSRATEVVPATTAARVIPKVAAPVSASPVAAIQRRPGLIIDFGESHLAPTGLNRTETDRYAASYCRSINYPSGRALDVESETGSTTRVSIVRIIRLICFD